ncbi:GNAT family N-acetyltransferase [Oceanobacillus salinisoli]|uniref:GNAT family N-acetyltransferase n=1 Tax=Oceanobacillus salinisoli TaxID=2678611 RepID=UPI0012E1CE99|nr:GNAT family N-acetyltransferase [Oceanobacillus salinisoli]
MAIRKATYMETQQILNYALDVMNEATAGHVEGSYEKAIQLISPFLKNGGYYLIYTDGKAIQGWIGIGFSYDPYTDKTVGMIPELFVLPAYRNKGIAKKLCDEAIEHLKQMGYSNIQLNVFAGNPAKKLYEKLGFHEVYTLMELEVD